MLLGQYIFLIPMDVSVLHEKEEEKVEFSWKRNRLYNHTACLVLYQICMEVGVGFTSFSVFWYVYIILLCMYIMYCFWALIGYVKVLFYVLVVNLSKLKTLCAISGHLNAL